MSLPQFLRDWIDAIVLRAYETTKDHLSIDLDGIPAAARSVLTSALPHMVTAIRDEVRSDLERVAMFTVLFRTQADQARRLDAVDATLGVFLTALLVVGPLALDKAPSVADRWIAVFGFGILILVVGLALFVAGGREPKADIALQLAGDLRSADRGTFEPVREALNDLRKDPFAKLSQDEANRRGAAGALARLVAQDRLVLLIKRRLLLAVAGGTLVLACIIGYRDVVQSPPEDRNGCSAISGKAASSDVRCDAADSGERRSVLRSGHPAAGLALVLCGQRAAITTPYPPGRLPLYLAPVSVPEPLLCIRGPR
jgi:hypothetical protein